MRKAWTLLLMAVLVMAGCAQDTGEDLPDADSYGITVSNLPTTVEAGETFTIRVNVDGPAAFTSDHIGAHYDDEAHDEPTTAAYAQACDHTEGDLPGVFDVTCTVQDAGTWHLRGHMRLTVGDNGQQIEYWSEDQAVEVTEVDQPDGNGTDGGMDGNGTDGGMDGNDTAPPSYNLTLSDVPTNVTANQTFNVSLTIEGDQNRTVEHIAAHFGNQSLSEPTVPAYGNNCDILSGDLPGNFTISCTIPENGTWYLRGHLMFTTDDGETLNFWSQEHVLTVEE